jgi:hypothetical protein
MIGDALRRGATIILVVFGALLCLVSFGLPREDGEVQRPGLLIAWYLLPMLGTFAATRLWPGCARRVWVPLLAAGGSFAGWAAIVAAW